MQTLRCVAGIDVHKKMLAVVVVGRVGEQTIEVERAKFSTTTQDLKRWEDWLETRGVDEVVMESTGQYHKPVWLQLEGRFQLHLAQARSNRGPRGRKRDFTDAMRLVKRVLSEDLILSYVPDAEQRLWRSMTRAKVSLSEQRKRLQGQIEGGGLSGTGGERRAISQQSVPQRQSLTTTPIEPTGLGGRPHQRQLLSRSLSTFGGKERT